MTTQTNVKWFVLGSGLDYAFFNATLLDRQAPTQNEISIQRQRPEIGQMWIKLSFPE